jgi:glutamate--cysteine ligase
MGDIGYTNAKEGETGVHIDYSGVEQYVSSLTHAIETPCPEYERIGIEVEGNYRQLNSNLLQIENEYYSTVRPKQVLQELEKPTLALKRRGVQYVELRSLDVNAFDPMGINEPQLYFLEIFMTFCLLLESPACYPGEQHDIDINQSKVAHQGRDPDLILTCNGKDIPLHQWLDELLAGMGDVAAMLDRIHNTDVYGQALAEQQAISRDTSRTPSARMLAQMRDNDEGFYHYAKRMSQQHYDYFRNETLSPEREQMFRQMAQQSLQQQRELEAEPQPPFGEFLQQYFAQKA